MIDPEKILYASNLILSKCLNVFLYFFGGRRSGESVNRIVCVKLDEIGDMANAVAVFAQLKSAFPQAKIDVLCKPFVKTLIEFDPNIDRIIFDESELTRYDIWVELRGNWKTLFYSIWKTKKYRVDRGTIRFKQRGNQLHETITNSRIIEPIFRDFCKKMDESFLQIPPKLYTNQGHIDTAKLRLEELGVLGKFVVVHPAARKKLRQWSPKKFEAIAVYLWEKHQIETVIMGTQDEVSILDEIQQQHSFVKSWVSNDSLLVFYEVVCNSEFFLGNESGPLQIADLSGKPVIGLFGPGVKNVFYPRQNVQSKVIHNVLDCNPCDQVQCVQEVPCIELIATIDVIHSIEEVLSTK